IHSDAKLTSVGTVLGTPAYLSPEQAFGKPLDHRCDLFSLGTVLYQMLTGELPFQGPDALSLMLALATENPQPLESLNPAVPPALVALVGQLMAKEPGERPPSAAAVAQALACLEQDSTQKLQPIAAAQHTDADVPLPTPRQGGEPLGRLSSWR